MGLVVRQSIQSSLISYTGVVIGYINLLYLYPKYLAPEQVGLLRTLQDAAILFTPFAQFGLAQTIIRYYPRFVSDKPTSQQFINLMLLLTLLGFGIFYLIYQYFEPTLLSYFEENAAAVLHYSSIIIGLTLCLVLVAILEAFSRSLLRTVIPNLLREVGSRLFLSILVLLYFSGTLSFDQFVVGTLVAHLVWLILLILYLTFNHELSFKASLPSVEKKKMVELLQFSLLSFAGMAGMILVGKIDSMMVAALLGLAANAVYTTAFYMATVIEIPKRAISQLAMPLISRAFEKNDMQDIERIYRKTSLNQFIIGLLLLMGVWINLDTLFNLMPNGDHYELGKWVVMIVGAGKLVDMVFGPSSEIIVLSKYYKFNIVLVLGLACLVIISNQLLIPRYGIEGAAWGSALALVIFNMVKYLFIYATLKIQPFSSGTIKVMGIGGFTLLINSLIPVFESSLVDVVVRSLMATLIFGSLIIIVKPSEEVTELYQQVLRYLRLIKKT